MTGDMTFAVDGITYRESFNPPIIVDRTHISYGEQQVLMGLAEAEAESKLRSD